MELADDTSTSTSTEDGTNSLQKADSSGNITNALTTTATSVQGPPPQLPKILTLAVSPAPYNEIFVHFENAFRFKEPSGNTTQTQGDPRLDGTYCQLFRVKGGDLETLKTTAPTSDNLECLDFEHFVNNWNASRLSVFQFDSSGNVYFPGAIPNSPKMVVYKWDPATVRVHLAIPKVGECHRLIERPEFIGHLEPKFSIGGLEARGSHP